MSDLAVTRDEVFVDTGYVIALENADDANHASARQQYELRAPQVILVTTTYVVDEVVTFFNVRGQHAKAVELGTTLLHSPSVTMIHIEETMLNRGLALLGERSDKRYSLTDCISFVVMRDRGISTAYAFDRHFEQEGFVGIPRPD